MPDCLKRIKALSNIDRKVSKKNVVELSNKVIQNVQKDEPGTQPV